MAKKSFRFGSVSLLWGLTFFSGPAIGKIEKAIKEADQLFLAQDRQGAILALKKHIHTTSKSDAKTIKSKLSQYGQMFFTDRGLQAFQVGKDLVLKRKYADAVEKLKEAQTLEGTNTQIVEYLLLSYIGTMKFDQAAELLKESEPLSGFELELLRGKLALLLSEKKWSETVKLADHLIRHFGDESVETLSQKAAALTALGRSDEARKAFETCLQKDRNFPEAYVGLAQVDKKQESLLYPKYLELCKALPDKKYARETQLCKKVDEVREKVNNGT